MQPGLIQHNYAELIDLFFTVPHQHYMLKYHSIPNDDLKILIFDMNDAFICLFTHLPNR